MGNTMKSKRVDRLADMTSPDLGRSSELRSPSRPSGLMQALLGNVVENIQAPRPSIPAFANQAGPSIAPKVLEFATSGTANCPDGRSCARLYLALQGMAIPLGDTAIALASTRSGWWLRAVFEGTTGIWAGNEAGARAIAAAQPLIWEQAQAATRAWERTKQEQDARLWSSCHDGPTEK